MLNLHLKNVEPILKMLNKYFFLHLLLRCRRLAAARVQTARGARGGRRGRVRRAGPLRRVAHTAGWARGGPHGRRGTRRRAGGEQCVGPTWRQGAGGTREELGREEGEGERKRKKLGFGWIQGI